MVHESSTQNDVTDEQSSKTGIIYLLTNPDMPGLVKIGKTERDDVPRRVRELWTTEVPRPFRCVRAVRVPDVDLAEKALHRAFDPERRHPRREFFSIEPEQAIALLDLIKLEDVTPESDQNDDALDVSDLDNRPRRKPIRFDDLKIPLGSELQFASRTITATATVVDGGTRVSYKDPESDVVEQEFSLTGLTKELLGYGKSAALAWTYYGRLLREISDEVHGWEE